MYDIYNKADTLRRTQKGDMCGIVYNTHTRTQIIQCSFCAPSHTIIIPEDRAIIRRANVRKFYWILTFRRKH